VWLQKKNLRYKIIIKGLGTTIHAYNVNNITISGNLRSQNQFGMALESVNKDCQIMRYIQTTGRCFIHPVEDYLTVFDNGSNTWDGGQITGCNYYSDYTGNDTNGDGKGELLYNISPLLKDNYPFIMPLGDFQREM